MRRRGRKIRFLLLARNYDVLENRVRRKRRDGPKPTSGLFQESKSNDDRREVENSIIFTSGYETDSDNMETSVCHE